MQGLLDSREIHGGATEGRSGLLAAARQLVGEKLLFAKPTYLVDIKLHFGTAIERKAPRGITTVHGSIVLSPVASSVEYTIPALNRTFAFPADGSPEDPEVVATLKEHLSNGGPTVSGVEVAPTSHGYSLTLGFSDGSAFTITPNPDPPGFIHDDEPVSDWEIFGLGGGTLRAGPGLHWSQTSREA